MPSDPVHIARSRVANTIRSKGPDAAEVIEARRELAAAKLRREVCRVIAAGPPLSYEQKRTIAALLIGGQH